VSLKTGLRTEFKTAPLRSAIRFVGTASCLRCRKRVRAVELEGDLCTGCAAALARYWEQAMRYEASLRP
jgi:hypothetical protein